MAKKPKLNNEQNLSLKGLNLQQKLEKLKSWYKSKEVSKEAFEYFSNFWINRESKKLQSNSPLRRMPRENFERRSRTVAEGQVQMLIDRLRGYINAYIANRSSSAVALTESEYAEFESYVTKYFSMYPAKIGRLLTIGLKYPDSSKRINNFCVDWIQNSFRRVGKDYYSDPHFWGLLWEDGNFVPLDAIRLMLAKDEKGVYQIDKRFDERNIKILLPYIEAQRDKEIERLKWAQTRDDSHESNQVPRKIRRLEAFNTLIDAAERYTQWVRI